MSERRDMPNRIWLQPRDDPRDIYDWTWGEHPISNDAVEYVRVPTKSERRAVADTEEEARLGRLLLNSVTPDAWGTLIGAVVDANDELDGPLLERLNEIGRALATQDSP